MQEMFSREPPVYAKPKDTNAAQTPPPRPPASSTSDYSHRPPPPLPVDRAASVGTPMQSTQSTGQNAGGPPPLPAKPGVPVPSAAFPPSRSTSVPLPQASSSLRSQSPAAFGTVRTRFIGLYAVTSYPDRPTDRRCDTYSPPPLRRDHRHRSHKT